MDGSEHHPTVPVHELHQFLLMGIQGQKKNRKIGALTNKSELAVTVHEYGKYLRCSQVAIYHYLAN